MRGEKDNRYKDEKWANKRSNVDDEIAHVLRQHNADAGVIIYKGVNLLFNIYYNGNAKQQRHDEQERAQEFPKYVAVELLH